MKEKKVKQKRKRGFGFWAGLLRIFIRKPKFIYLDKEIKPGSIILSNHVGKTAPLKLELYLNTPFRFWGAHEMNDGFRSLYKYQSEVFYHQKQHWNLFFARLFCVIASPLTYFFYKGLNLISTYRDYRFLKTIKESINTIKDNQSIIIFPEDSSEGYFDNLKSFHAGFVVFANACYKKGIDLPIYVTYFRKKDNTYIVDKHIKYSSFVERGLSREQIAEYLCKQANEIKDVGLKK